MPDADSTTDRILVLDGETTTAALPGHPPPPEEPTWEPLEALGRLTVYPRTGPEQTADRIREHAATVLVSNKTVIDRGVLERVEGVGFISLLATGTNVIDLDAAREHGVVVSNVPGYSTESVVQHVFALLLALSNRAAVYDRHVREGAWVNSADFTFSLGPYHELAGRTLGIVGVGDIGKRVAQVGQALGMRIVAARQRSTGSFTVQGLGGPLSIEWMELDEVFGESDVLTLHCPLNAQTAGLVNARRLSRMKPGSLLVNTGRGGLIDESALAEALAEGRIGGAGLDVLSSEPPAPDNPLLSAPRCVITPHIAWATVEARTRLIDAVAANISGYQRGEPVNVVSG